MGTLAGKTVFVTGGSRGIGRAIALRCARDGANVVLASKSEKPHPKLGGSIHEVAAEVVAAGGKALPLALDVQDAGRFEAVVRQAATTFGGIDALVHNAGAISLTPVEKTPVKLYDRMMDINARAVFVGSQAALPFLKESRNPHIVSLSPPLDFRLKWVAPHSAYTLSKYGMTLLSLGMAEEFAPYGISVNCLWPKTIIATAAIEFALGGREMFAYCRKPDIMADAVREILLTEGRALTGQTLVDESFLRSRGTTDFDRYAHDPAHAHELGKDLFIE